MNGNSHPTPEQLERIKAQILLDARVRELELRRNDELLRCNTPEQEDAVFRMFGRAERRLHRRFER